MLVEESGLCKTLWAEIVRNKCVKVCPGCPVLIKLKGFGNSFIIFIYFLWRRKKNRHVEAELYCH